MNKYLKTSLRILMIVICFNSILFADTISTTEVRIGDVNQSPSAHWPAAGISGNNNPLNPLQNAGVDKPPKSYHTIYIPSMDGLSLERINSLAYSVSADRILFKDNPAMISGSSLPSNIFLWKPGEEIYGTYLNTTEVYGKKNENREAIIARAITEMCPYTKANYYHVSVLVRERQDSETNSAGTGATRILSELAAWAGGFLFTKSELEAGEYLIYLVKAYYVKPKNIVQTKTIQIKQEEPVTENTISEKSEIRISPKPPMFDYNVWKIYQDQAPAIMDIGKILLHLSRTNTPVIIEGKCDERGGESYNLGLGDRRATSVKEAAKKSTLMQSPQEEHRRIEVYFDTMVKTVSAGESKTIFGPAEHWKDRRCDLIIDGKNVTLPNIEGGEK